MRTRLASLLALPVATGGALVATTVAPAHHFAPVEIRGYAFSPSSVTIAANEEVLWTWTGLDRNHSVTAEPGQAEAFDSDPQGVRPAPQGRGYSWVFRTPGTYRYLCKVHPTMRGTVVVTPAADGAGTTTDPTSTSPAADDTRPVVDRLRVTRRARSKLAVRFRLDERADVELGVERLRPGRSAQRVLTRSLNRAAGTHRATLGVQRLRRGRYRLTVSAIDAANNVSRTLRAAVTLVR
ncbi:plastocyanin/azurin family copper-binding protein [Conexibacter sp. SYSU D00693]|uniref:cupredoxin domain-containing protein n=1 Tax=Conexibacter sp. SYSU D00693 TaxID=2812560 RepID=UPI00196A7F58|nr:plastocyanin/azurin family copper-binding protein [Conexibacter sp. SYSU D00693]